MDRLQCSSKVITSSHILKQIRHEITFVRSGKDVLESQQRIASQSSRAMHCSPLMTTGRDFIGGGELEGASDDSLGRADELRDSERKTLNSFQTILTT